jgi:hypothetical protein
LKGNSTTVRGRILEGKQEKHGGRCKKRKIMDSKVGILDMTNSGRS